MEATNGDHRIILTGKFKVGNGTYDETKPVFDALGRLFERKEVREIVNKEDVKKFMKMVKDEDSDRHKRTVTSGLP